MSASLAVPKEARAFDESQPAAPVAQPAFDIGEYRVIGNSKLDARSIETAVYPHLGPHKTFADVESARAALESAYRDHGFGTVFVDIPEQTVDEGIVRLHVTEGTLHAATISGARYYSERQIRAAIPAAKTGTVPDLQELRSEISAVNAATPDRQVVPVLKAGPEPGTVDLALNVDDRLPLHGSLELNNQYTVGTTPLRLLGTLSYGNVFGRQDTFSLQYQTAPENRDNAKVIAAAYTANVGSNRGQLTFSYIDSDSAVATVGTLAFSAPARPIACFLPNRCIRRPASRIHSWPASITRIPCKMSWSTAVRESIRRFPTSIRPWATAAAHPRRSANGHGLPCSISAFAAS